MAEKTYRTMHRQTLVCLAIICGLAGCDDSSGGRHSISGTVTYESEPLAKGNITFLPKNGGQPAASMVVAGDFSIPAKKGLMPGKYRVEIKARRATGKTFLDEESGKTEDELVQYLPPKYNRRTELEVTVVRGDRNTFSFELSGAEQ